MLINFVSFQLTIFTAKKFNKKKFAKFESCKKAKNKFVLGILQLEKVKTESFASVVTFQHKKAVVK